MNAPKIFEIGAGVGVGEFVGVGACVSVGLGSSVGVAVGSPVGEGSTVGVGKTWVLFSARGVPKIALSAESVPFLVAPSFVAQLSSVSGLVGSILSILILVGASPAGQLPPSAFALSISSALEFLSSNVSPLFPNAPE